LLLFRYHCEVHRPCFRRVSEKKSWNWVEKYEN
jgi:hypothetical protein